MSTQDEGWLRFERRKRGIAELWEIRQHGTEVQVRGGSAETLASEAAAKRRLQKLIAERMKQGFEMIVEADASQTIVPAKPQVAVLNPDLEAEIRAAPDDPGPYQVYADWLQEQGDPRGDLIAVQVALASSSSSDEEEPKLRAREDELLRTWPDHFLPERVRDALEQGDVRLTWRFGYLRSAYLVPAVARELLLHPSARFLRELTFGPCEDMSEYARIGQAWDGVHLGTLQRLVLANFNRRHSEISWVDLGDLSDLSAAMPNLRDLWMQCGRMKLGKLDFPELRAFAIMTGGLAPASLDAIAKAKWPKLESLTIYFGHSNYGAGTDVDEIRPILFNDELPCLTHLGLMNSELTNELCAMLPDATLAGQLLTLDLSLGVMNDDGARALAAGAKSFPKLISLDVSKNFLTKDGIAALTGAFSSVVSDEQRESDDEERYVVVGE